MSRSLNDFGRGISNDEDVIKPKAQSLVLNLGKSTEGIDESFDPPLESKYECPICLLGLREPVQTQCGHRFCRNCIVRSLRESGNRCPVDNAPLSESGLYPDNFAKREMGMFTVWCRHHKGRGCKWKGTLNDLETHLKTCQFVDVTCPNKCGTVVQLKQIEEHMNVCPKRKVVCDFCKNMVYFTELQNHYKECPKYETICSKCKEKVTNEKIKFHREKVCPKEKIKCPLEFLGCNEENFIPEINKHIAMNLSSHIYDLAKAVKSIQQQQSKAETQRPVATQEGARAGQLSGASSSGYSEDRLFETAVLMPTDLKRLGDRVTRLENRHIDLEGRVCSGTFIWKVENYEQCRVQAVNHSIPAIHSPPFYTSLYGYKMCLRMNLNGVDSGVGRHISLFVHMMQGEWDDILEWPFTGRITLAILDQSDNEELRRPIMDTLVAKPNLLAFQKPTTHRNHKGYGYVEFCQIDQLVQDQFIKNNSMLVRIHVITDHNTYPSPPSKFHLE